MSDIISAFFSQAVGAAVLFSIIWLIARNAFYIGGILRGYEKKIINKLRRAPTGKDMILHKGKMVDKRDLDKKH